MLCFVKGLFLIIPILLALSLVRLFKSCLPLDRDVKNLITDSIVLECLQLCPSPGVGIVPIFPLPWCIDITMFVTILLWHGMCPFLSFHCLDYLQIFPMNPSHFMWLMVWFMMLSARTVVKNSFDILLTSARKFSVR